MPIKFTRLIRAVICAIVLPMLFSSPLLPSFDTAFALVQTMNYISTGTTSTTTKPRIDKDGDGLSDEEEKTFGTNPKSPDSDKDGLIDSDEINIYHTNPSDADSDNDGLSDFDELKKYHTDPNHRDSDRDGLDDRVELRETLTNPLRPDTDGDGLSDGDEIARYRTNPMRRDSDGDGLSDGAEVRGLFSNALAADSDRDGVADEADNCPGEAETQNGYEDADGCPDTKPEFWAEIGESYLLSEITFAEGQTKPASSGIEQMEKVYRTLRDFPELAFEIRGYADNTGEAEQNLYISHARAQAIYNYLVAKGISRDRLRCAGFGESNAIASNNSAEGRAQNRRIELYRLH